MSKSESLPYNVGKMTPEWTMVMGLAVLMLVFGAYAYAQQLIHGEVVTGLRDIGVGGGVPWGLYIVFVVYFIGISFAGITVAALIRVFNLEHLKPISRMAEVLTVVALIMGAFSVVADVGQPARALPNLLKLARPQSPFFGTFTLVIAGYLFASLVYLFLDTRKDAAACAKTQSKLQWLHKLLAAGYGDTETEREKHKTASYWLALSIIPLLLVAHSTLGFVFGLQSGRPGWFSALQAPSFVVLAGISGMGILIVLATIVRRYHKAEEELNMGVFSWMGKFLMGLLGVYIYFVIVEALTITFEGHIHENNVAGAIMGGQYSGMYWGSVGLLVLSLIALMWQSYGKKWSIGTLTLVGIAVNIAAILKRYVIVVPSQTHGVLLPYDIGTYAPTWVEYGVVMGIMAFGILIFGMFMKAIPIIPLKKAHGE